MDERNTVGALARRLGLSVRTLHHYDAIGLVVPSGRTDAGYRVYAPADVQRLANVLAYRACGLSLADIARLLDDEIFKLTMFNTVFYLVVQVPIMLILAMVLANLLNDPKLRGKALWRTMIFLPCAVSLVSYSLVFRTMFATDGLVNDALMAVGLMHDPLNWLGEPWTARFVIIIGLLWRWTGYNMIFFLAALQNVDHSTLEAARIDGAGAFKTFWFVTVPQLRPMIVLTAIMSINGTMQLFDESWALTKGGPSYNSMSMSHYLYELAFLKNPNVGYASAISYVILIMVAVLALIQMKVGDKRD